ncbi:O-antigen ligase family protein [Parvularcula dongshanensis]|uniref:O-antigen ligase-related domain-containing protein n=1 Tax=Parvularcula dongshanensis TaxID=1173995 RepID=A0A840I592_9PROT|nr:O-antigen ligase family protein [Parvularcula dongshanensis]MBB4660009.1 hypothetical protein [Parvularcula dongshanensis]
MIQNIYVMKAGLFVLVAIALGAAARPRLADETIYKTALIYYVGATALLFGLANPMVILLAILVFALILRPRDSVAAAALYPAFLFVIPAGFSWLVPFPGINYLFDLNNARALAFAVLIPTAIAIIARREKGAGLSATDKWVIAYATLTFFLGFRAIDTFTNTARLRIYDLLGLPLVYFVLSRAPRTPRDAELMLRGLFYASMFLLSIGTIGAVQRWNHYFNIRLSSSFNASAFRGGTFRISGPMSPVDFGFWIAFAGACLLLLRDQFVRYRALAWAWLPAVILVMFSTGSRGVLLAGMVMVAAYLMFLLKTTSAKVLYVSSGVAGAFLLYQTLSATGFSSIDEYGTFAYREELLKAAVRHVKAYPIFGNTDYATSPFFADLVQGQGIIDFVNGFIQIVLPYGLVGLILFVGMIVSAWLGVVKAVSRIDRSTPDGAARWNRGVALGVALPGFCTVMATTSFVAYMYPTLLILVACSAAYARLADQIVAEDEAAEPAPPAPVEPAPQASPPAPDPERGFWPDGYVPGRTGWPS